ncbi:hypothetical protein SynBIOSE41_02870 [Synechococcus sp. BIOS-E4-1]|nr:hypothetical protein SynBIOSE41_02870 [Synechococcus sp. BIOS-E4-1]
MLQYWSTILPEGHSRAFPGQLNALNGSQIPLIRLQGLARLSAVEQT